MFFLCHFSKQSLSMQRKTLHCLHLINTSCLFFSEAHCLHFPLLSFFMGQWATPMFSMLETAFLFLDPRNFPISCLHNCILKLIWVLDTVRPLLVVIRWLADSFMHMNALTTERSTKNHSRYFHHFRDFLEVEYCIRSWSARSTPNINLLYCWPITGHGTSFTVPSFCFLWTWIFSCGSQFVEKTVFYLSRHLHKVHSSALFCSPLCFLIYNFWWIQASLFCYYEQFHNNICVTEGVRAP